MRYAKKRKQKKRKLQRYCLVIVYWFMHNRNVKHSLKKTYQRTGTLTLGLQFCNYSLCHPTKSTGCYTNPGQEVQRMAVVRRIWNESLLVEGAENMGIGSDNDLSYVLIS